MDQIGFYGRLESVPTPKLKVVLAARVDVPDAFDTQVSPKAALIYKPELQMALRATAGRAYRSPNVNHQFLLFPVRSGLIARGNQGFRFGSTESEELPEQFRDGIDPIKPEKSTTYELGFKGLLATRYYLDVTAYTSYYKDFISPLRTIGDPSNGIVVLDENGEPRDERTLTYLNFGSQRASGFDVGLDVYTFKKLVVRGNFSYVNAGELKDAAGISQPFNTPDFTVNLGASSSDLVVPGTSMNVAVRHVDGFDYQEGVHVGHVPTYAVLDVDLGYRSRHGIVYRISAQNLLDNEHIEVPDGARIGRAIVGEAQYGF